MSDITISSKDLSEVIANLEKTQTNFYGLYGGLEAAMLDEDEELFGEVEILLDESIRELKKLTGQ